MSLKPPIAENKPFQVSYQAQASSAGATLIVVGWVPKDGNSVPQPQEIIVAPGATGSISGIVPAAADARRMDLRVDLPDGTGAGVLQLSISGLLVAHGVLTQDDTWTSIVV
jgi:hypothetical protein